MPGVRSGTTRSNLVIVMDASDHDLLIRIDEKMDAVQSWQQEHMTKCHTVHDKHDTRITKLEEWKYREAGALALLVFVVQAFGTWIKEKLLP